MRPVFLLLLLLLLLPGVVPPSLSPRPSNDFPDAAREPRAGSITVPTRVGRGLSEFEFYLTNLTILGWAEEAESRGKTPWKKCLRMLPQILVQNVKAPISQRVEYAAANAVCINEECHHDFGRERK